MSVHFVNTNKAERVTPASPPAIGSYTLACRVNLDTVTRDHILAVINSGTGNGLAQLQLDTGAGKKWGFVEANDTNTQFGEAIGTTTVAASTWYHVCGTYDGTTMTLYVNGVAEGTFTPSLVVPRAGNWATFQAPISMDGSIQDVYACTGALSAMQVLRLARARFPVDRAGIQYWIPYTNGVSSALNFSGVQGSLTITGSPTAGPEAGVPWGTQQQQPILRSLGGTLISASGSQLETGAVDVGLSKDATSAGSQLETGLVTATLTKDVGAATGSAVQTGIVNVTGGSAFLNGAASGAQLQTGTVTVTLSKDATAAGSALQTASVATTETALVVAAGTQRESGLVTVTGGTPAAAPPVSNGGQGRRFGNRLMPALMRR